MYPPIMNKINFIKNDERQVLAEIVRSGLMPRNFGHAYWREQH
jgi:hypothetical protein